MTQNKVAKPFLKWVGGKGHLLTDIRQKYPKELESGICSYIEPFVGGGAVLFDILSHFKLKTVIINDINPKLTNCYSIIRDNVEDLINILKDYEESYKKLNLEQQKRFYYSKRDIFNSFSIDTGVEAAALFIFLNKTCFNGLYRENSSGNFNVPIGRYNSPLICDCDNLRACSKALSEVKILTGDYAKALKKVTSHSFVYIDPPYRPISETAAFTAYHKAEIFDDKEQIRLAKEISYIIGKGAKVMISNSDPKNTNQEDDFFDSLYTSNLIERIPVMRFINGKEKKTVSELLITNKYDYIS